LDDDEEMADELALEGLEAGDAAATRYLEARTRVMDAEYERLHLSHFREWMYTALEAIIGLILFLVFAAVASAVYQAGRADGLVIESFSAPPDLVQKGLTGQVLASKLLDRLNAMQSATSSSRAASSFSHDWGNDIKVAIPDTGVSLGEVIRYLHNWLGHEMHLSGELYEQGDKVALTVRLEGEAGQTFSGRAADLDAIVQQAAEAVFRRAQTYRYSVFLEYHGRTREAEQVLKGLSETGSAKERAWADHGLALFLANAGRYEEARAKDLRAQTENPELPNPPAGLGWLAAVRGHDEEALGYTRQTLALLGGKGASELSPETIRYQRALYNASIAEALGDYRSAVSTIDTYGLVPNAFGNPDVLIEAANDRALAHDGADARARLSRLDPDKLGPEPDTVPLADVALVRGQIALAQADWRAAARAFEEAQALGHARAQTDPGFYSYAVYRHVTAGPWLAYALAMQGETAKAEAILKTLPGDCYVCARIRGRIAAHEGRMGAAAWWFARAAGQAPSLPFAQVDWGAMLLARGDTGGAAAKFAQAVRKAPHYADAQELWGEALIKQNRADLALAKFEEAAKYAPNWGRLHLMWGEALLWSGHKDEAKKQLAIAAQLGER
jgi:tetratricopeptide (TPR) repeat protein